MGLTLVVGAGLGGLSCALGLAREGKQVHVVEAAPQLGEIGAGIQLAPNATRVLDAFGLLDEIREKAVFPRELVYRDAWSGERITSVDLGEPFIARYGHPYIVMHRGDLHAALLEACIAHSNVSLETNKRVDGIEDRGDVAIVRCADGSTYEAGAVVGADGLHSFIRQWLAGDDLVPTPHVAYRGPIPSSEINPHENHDSMVMWVGPDLHFVQYKLRGGELYNQVGVFRSYRYGQTQDYGSPAELDEHFSRCCETVRYGGSFLSRDMRWPMADREPIHNWTRNRVTLLGDAAHPMLQYIAQGACQAIEDAACLAQKMSGDTDVAEAFRAYQEERIPRTARVQITARRFGEACHLGGVARELRNHVFSQRTPQDYTVCDWLYQASEPQSELSATLATTGRTRRLGT